MPQVLTGNFNIVTTPPTEWVMGFNDNAAIRNADVALKWSKLKKGADKLIPYANKVSTTLGILITGQVRVYFPDTKQEVILSKEGDYIFIPPNIMHTREVLEDSFTISLRWPAIVNDQIS